MFQGHDQHTLEKFGGKGAPVKSYRDRIDSVRWKIKSDVIPSDVESMLDKSHQVLGANKMQNNMYSHHALQRPKERYNT